uniref:Ig-like domain-containing protein n=1 Tax=Amphimedon queenslandica TaxID=400682 RepID=A0A1X7UGP3_AMPQE
MTLFLLLLISVIVSTSGNVEVTFTLSHDPPTIAEGGTAVFNCSSNHSLVTITWYLNKTVLASTLTSLGVIVNGAATPVSSLIMPGLVDPFNNTEVQCVAFGFGIGDFSPPSVILRVQVNNSEFTISYCFQLFINFTYNNWKCYAGIVTYNLFCVSFCSSIYCNLVQKKRCVIHRLMISSFYKHDIGNTRRTQEEKNPSPPAQYENIEMITGTNPNVYNIPTNECSAYGVVIQDTENL